MPGGDGTGPMEKVRVGAEGRDSAVAEEDSVLDGAVAKGAVQAGDREKAKVAEARRHKAAPKAKDQPSRNNNTRSSIAKGGKQCQVEIELARWEWGR